ncbi:Dual specificity tyrosine-phosphorylation-regulated kinase, partial [Gonapodya sp. JEL0774]
MEFSSLPSPLSPRASASSVRPNPDPNPFQIDIGGIGSSLAADADILELYSKISRFSTFLDIDDGPEPLRPPTAPQRPGAPTAPVAPQPYKVLRNVDLERQDARTAAALGGTSSSSTAHSQPQTYGQRTSVPALSGSQWSSPSADSRAIGYPRGSTFAGSSSAAHQPQAPLPPSSARLHLAPHSPPGVGSRATSATDTTYERDLEASSRGNSPPSNRRSLGAMKSMSSLVPLATSSAAASPSLGSASHYGNDSHHRRESSGGGRTTPDAPPRGNGYPGSAKRGMIPPPTALPAAGGGGMVKSLSYSSMLPVPQRGGAREEDYGPTSAPPVEPPYAGKNAYMLPFSNSIGSGGGLAAASAGTPKRDPSRERRSGKGSSSGTTGVYGIGAPPPSPAQQQSRTSTSASSSYPYTSAAAAAEAGRASTGGRGRSTPHEERPGGMGGLTGNAVQQKYFHYLTPYERTEILTYPAVWFIGHPSAEKVGSGRPRSKANLDLNKPDPSAAAGGDSTDPPDANGLYNHGYDDARGDIILTLEDHIGYRYEIVSLLGKGSFGQVVKCWDHRERRFVAVKIIRNKKRFEKQGMVEVKVLERLKHA